MNSPGFPDSQSNFPEFENSALSRSEYIAAITHFYRAEMQRATTWRIRLDTTTNWAIISVMGLVTFALGDATHSHLGIIGGMALVFTFLVIEARRFRFFDVWRSRVRMLEENFVVPVLRRDQISPVKDWGNLVAEDLLRPSFKLSWYEAMRVRLIRNYLPMFAILLISWIIKLNTAHTPFGAEKSAETAWERLSLGSVPGWIPLTFVVVVYSYLIGIIFFCGTHRRRGCRLLENRSHRSSRS